LLVEVWKYAAVVSSDGARRARAVLTIDLKNDPAIIETYRTHHQQVWPEVVSSLQRAGIRTMDIYILGRRLVMILETDGPDFQQCMALHVASDPRVAEWEALMHSMQEPPPGGRHENWWSVMEPLFHLDDAQEEAEPRHRVG
jgi:L-rhamnose mutarotase